MMQLTSSYGPRYILGYITKFLSTIFICISENTH